MKRFLYFTLLLFVAIGTACSGSQTLTTAEPLTPTNIPEQPTATSIPTNTSTPEPTATATPDAAATAVAQSTQTAGVVLAELEELLSDSEIAYQEGYLAWQQTEPITINMSGPSSDDTVVEIDKNLTASNFIMKSDVTWNATGWMFCGAIFRSEPDLDEGKQYQFYFLRLSGLPVWYIDLFENSDFVNSISKERVAREIDMANGAVNQFVLVAEDEMFTVYFNGSRQGRYFDHSKQLTEGSLGFFAWQESGTGSCKYENSWVWSLGE